MVQLLFKTGTLLTPVGRLQTQWYEFEFRVKDDNELELAEQIKYYDIDMIII